jgi:hypothetical protein
MLLGLSTPDSGGIEVSGTSAVGKTNARNRIEAVQAARSQGWL